MATARYLTKPEIRQMSDSFKKLGRYAEYTIFHIGINTGFRIAEILSLKVGDIATLDGSIKEHLRVKAKYMKRQRKARTIKLPEHPQGIIAAWINDQLTPKAINRAEDWLFPNYTAPLESLPYQTVLRTFKRAAINARINSDRVTTHSMRKTWVYLFLDSTTAKSPDTLLQQAGGWENTESMMRYKPKDDELFKIDQTQDAIGGAISEIFL